MIHGENKTKACVHALKLKALAYGVTCTYVWLFIGDV